MTKTQLGQAGYKNDDKSLPAAAGYYNTPKFGRIYLYDRQEATPKKASTKKRTVIYVERIVLPEAIAAPLFQRYREARDERTKETNHETLAAESAAVREIANLISSTTFFTAEEIAQLSGEVISLAIRITPVRRIWPAERVTEEMRDLVTLACNAYIHWRFKPSRQDEPDEAELIEGAPLSSQDLDDLGYFGPDSDEA
jgi:hypothetical protein